MNHHPLPPSADLAICPKQFHYLHDSRITSTTNTLPPKHGPPNLHPIIVSIDPYLKKKPHRILFHPTPHSPQTHYHSPPPPPLPPLSPNVHPPAPPPNLHAPATRPLLQPHPAAALAVAPLLAPLPRLGGREAPLPDPAAAAHPRGRPVGEPGEPLHEPAGGRHRHRHRPGRPVREDRRRWLRPRRALCRE